MSESFNIHMFYQQINFCIFVFLGGSDSWLHINGCVRGWGEWGGALRKVSGLMFEYWQLHPLGDYGDRGWIGVYGATLIILYLFYLIFCTLQSPTLNPSNTMKITGLIRT